MDISDWLAVAIMVNAVATIVLGMWFWQHTREHHEHCPVWFWNDDERGQQ